MSYLSSQKDVLGYTSNTREFLVAIHQNEGPCVCLSCIQLHFSPFMQSRTSNVHERTHPISDSIFPSTLTYPFCCFSSDRVSIDYYVLYVFVVLVKTDRMTRCTLSNSLLVPNQAMAGEIVLFFNLFKRFETQDVGYKLMEKLVDYVCFARMKP